MCWDLSKTLNKQLWPRQKVMVVLNSSQEIQSLDASQEMAGYLSRDLFLEAGCWAWPQTLFCLTIWCLFVSWVKSLRAITIKIVYEEF